jgi:hypothetical protein
MRIHNIYADENGETHFRDVEIELSEAGPVGTTSKRFPATGIIFRTTLRIGSSIGIQRHADNMSSIWMRRTASPRAMVKRE